MFILGLLGGELSPPKISDSPPKVVSDLVIAIHYISFSFTYPDYKSALIIVVMTFFFLLFNSSWAGQLSKVHFSVVIP